MSGPEAVELASSVLGRSVSRVRDIDRVPLDGSDVRRGSAPDEPPEQALDELLELTPILFEAARELA